jgi:hypothetical protein
VCGDGNVFFTAGARLKVAIDAEQRKNRNPNMPKRKANELDNGADAPRRSSRRVSTALVDVTLETAKAAPTARKSKTASKASKDEKPIVNGKEDGFTESVGTSSPFPPTELLPLTLSCSKRSGDIGHMLISNSIAASFYPCSQD